MVFFKFDDLEWEVVLYVEIGGHWVVEHHYLNFP